MMSESKSKFSYRPDIDGLRALAILPVVVFHAFPVLAPGGFVGVDVFFVISGYLISLILFRSMERGDLSFVDFYEHRILRIFPALLLVLLTCFVVGWFTLMPDEFKQLGKHIAAGAGFVENFTLWLESGYFDLETEKKPLMHLWSLAIEEQFYMVFPLLIWLAARFSWPILWIVGVICALSLGGNILGAYFFDVKLTFLSPLTRFWELMVGSLLAFHRVSIANNNQVPNEVEAEGGGNGKSRVAKTRHASVISFIGFCFILGSIFFIDKNMLYPGVFAVFPVLGAALIILGGKDAWLNRVILSNNKIVYIGKISYPLYLWHWPLLSIPLVILADRPGLAPTALIVILSFALASLTYYFIEKPIRYGLRNRRLKAFGLVLFLVVIGYVGYNAYERNGLPFRTKKILANNAQIGFREVPDSYAYLNNCVSRYPRFDGGCILAKNQSPTIALLGDSHSLNLFYGLAELSKADEAVNILNLRRDSSFFLKNVATFGRDTDARNRKEMAETSSITQQAMDIVATTSTIHTVIIVLRGADYFDGQKKTIRLINHPELTDNREVWQAALRETLSYLRGLGKKVVVVLDWPKLGFDPKVCVDFQPLMGNPTQQPCTMPRSESESRTEDFHKLANGVLNDFKDVTIFDSSTYFCDQVLCYGKKEGEILYADSEHLSVQGALYIGNFLIPYLRQSP